MAKRVERVQMDYHLKCVICTKRTKPKERVPLSGIRNQDVRDYFIKKYHVHLQNDTNEVSCRKCRQQFYACKRDNKMPVQPIIRTDLHVYERHEGYYDNYTHSRCFICVKPGPKLVRVRKDARHQLFIDQNILLSSGARCCPKHICGKYLTDISLQLIKGKDKIRNVTTISNADLSNLLEHLRQKTKAAQHNRVCFDDGSLTSEDYVTLTGLLPEQFNDLVGYLKTSKNSSSKSKRTTLGVFLMKVKTGMSDKLISTVLNLSKSQVQRSIVSVKKQLMKYFVPHFVGFQHIDRRDVIQSYTRTLAISLFGRNECSPPAILALGGTYIYINNKFQRRTYSVHKKRSLVKPMMIVSTSGYIVSVLGPFLADGKNNDASILNTVLENNVEMVKDWVHNGDIFVVDRGFRDSLDVLEKMGIDAKMPSFLPKGNKQLGTTEANESRLVTKVRWVVESANARLKQWRLLDKKHSQHLICL
ncbi:hypothetical protein MAR_001460 [Mya arenaria]|uniref:DDE Tnp4 domain-containing protein n=1 Tax=Mya arenaria TaxID=6604 RepID=A0ABY7FDH1_MYAAR|nr:hypothetical protein MAR_001460 [Mya arenaria]